MGPTCSPCSPRPPPRCAPTRCSCTAGSAPAPHWAAGVVGDRVAHDVGEDGRIPSVVAVTPVLPEGSVLPPLGALAGGTTTPSTSIRPTRLVPSVHTSTSEESWGRPCSPRHHKHLWTGGELGQPRRLHQGGEQVHQLHQLLRDGRLLAWEPHQQGHPVGDLGAGAQWSGATWKLVVFIHSVCSPSW